MTWSVRPSAQTGGLDVAYRDSPVLDGIRLWARKGAADRCPLRLKPYGEPYVVPAPGGAQVIAHYALAPEGTGPDGVLLEVGCGPTRVYLRLYPIGEWWDYTLQAGVSWGDEVYLCRVEPGAEGEVVQAGLGLVESRLCDSLFDKRGDRVLRFGADGVRELRADGARGSYRVETSVRTTFGSIPDLLWVEVLGDFVTERRGMPHYTPLDRTIHPLPPSGWESWYCYDKRTSEAILVTVSDWLEQHLKPFGCDVVQWDDGYQDESWLEWRQDLFPRGGKWIADYIRSNGFTPGIWVLPQSLGKVDSKYLQTKPEWVLRDAAGEAFRRFGNYPYVDPTHPEVKTEWFERIFRTMAREWGIDFFKIDGEGEMQQWYAMCRQQLFDPSVTPDEAYRGWLAIIRQAIGPQRRLLICATQWRAMGFGDSCRTGTDVGERWPSVERALQATFSNYWMHTIAWYCDPDVLIVRPTLSLDQARAWSSLLGLSGQVLLVSDAVHELPEERVELLRRVFPALGIRPMDLWPRRPYGPYPQVWDLKVATDWGAWDVVGLFRWYEDNEAEVSLTPQRLGLAPGRYVLYDVWEKTYLGELGPGRTFRLEPESCKVVCIRALERVPLLLGTSRHITQGYQDLEALSFDAATGVLSGASRLVGRDPYEVRILTVDEVAGASYRCEGVTAPGAGVHTRQEGPVLVITLTTPQSRSVPWQVALARSQAEVLP